MGKYICMSVSILCLVICGRPVYAMPYYTITDIGVLPGYSSSIAKSINNSGQVVGVSHSSIDNISEHSSTVLES